MKNVSYGKYYKAVTKWTQISQRRKANSNFVMNFFFLKKLQLMNVSTVFISVY